MADRRAQDYEPPEVAIFEQESEPAWSDAVLGESPPDDSVTAVDDATGEPEIRGYVVPEARFAADDRTPRLYVAPEDPGRKAPAKKRKPKKTKKAGKTTRAHSTRVKLTGHDAFGAVVCTCDLICTCNLVCSCESVSTCSCVSYSAPSTGGVGTLCSCDLICTCNLITM